MDFRKRIDALKKRLKKESLDGLLVTKKKNIIYLSGFDAENASLLITADGRDYIITDSRYSQLAQEDFSDFETKVIDGSHSKIINDIVRKRRVKNLGFESDWLTVTQLAGLDKRLRRAKLLPRRCLIEDLRIVKDDEEIALIRRSVSIMKRGFLYIKERVKPGLTGIRLAALIDNFTRIHGSERSPFQTIAAQEPYSSHPHAVSTDKPFGRSVSILIDAGAVYRGYNSDLTRLFFLARISSKLRYIYNIVKTAQRKAIDKIAPGARARDIDRAGRRYIEAKGFGKHFLHSLGHGVGLEIHELPTINKKSKAVLRPGMVFTVEPGIYIRGLGGIRLEDMVLVTEKGCEVLSDDIPK